jgi:hypothetical protein
MTTRHITVSTQQGIVTELELIGQGFGPGERYILRYHKTAPYSANRLEMSLPDVAWRQLSGFCYRSNEISVLLLRQGRPSAVA